MKPSTSPQRNSFQHDAYLERCAKEGESPSEDYLKMFADILKQSNHKWDDPASRVNNLEYDLVSTDWILEKVRGDNVYAQNLYAAICNNEFQRLDTWPILKGETCGYSWRYAGGIIADMQQKGDYIDWYCSGIRNSADEADDVADLTEEQIAFRKQQQAYVGEGFVTDEIRQDLEKLGWTVLDSDDA